MTNEQTKQITWYSEQTSIQLLPNNAPCCQHPNNNTDGSVMRNLHRAQIVIYYPNANADETAKKMYISEYNSNSNTHLVWLLLKITSII